MQVRLIYGEFIIIDRPQVGVELRVWDVRVDFEIDIMDPCQPLVHFWRRVSWKTASADVLMTVVRPLEFSFLNSAAYVSRNLFSAGLTRPVLDIWT